jgi:hypothetical protein
VQKESRRCVRYFYHPESDSLFTAHDLEYVGTDGLVEEIDEATFRRLQSRKKNEEHKMTVRVGGIWIVDGAEIQILTEGGSAKEAYEALLHEAGELGGVLPGGEAQNGDKPKATRNRRTKAEIDAARAAAVDSGNAALPRQPTPDLPGPAAPPQQPAPMSAFGPGGGAGPVAAPFAAPAQNIPVGPESVVLAPGQTRPGDWAPPEGPPVGFTDAPRAPQDGKSVGFGGPPPPFLHTDGPPLVAPLPPAPPARSEEDVLRDQVDAVLERTIALQPAWADNVRQAWAKSCGGEQMGVMRADRLREVLRGVEDYERRVKEALGRS